MRCSAGVEGEGSEFTNPLDRCSELHMEEASIMRFLRSGYSGDAFSVDKRLNQGAIDFSNVPVGHMCA